MKHNNVLPNVHYRKEWDLRVRTWLDQPARKHRRREARKAKADAIAPRPVNSLRPVVRSQTVRYNTKVRTGRGFTLEEIRAAGITAGTAKSLKIAVDHRRTNKSEASLAANVQRLKEYLGKVVVAKRGGKKAAKKEVKLSTSVATKSASRKTVTGMAQVSAPGAPAPAKAATEYVSVTEELTKGGTAYAALRQAWINARLLGKRAKKAKEAAEAKPKAADE